MNTGKEAKANSFVIPMSLVLNSANAHSMRPMNVRTCFVLFFFCLSVGKQWIWHRCIVQSQSRVVDTGQEKWWSVVSGLATHLKYCYWPSGDDWKKRKSFCDSMNESIALRPTSVDFSLINYMSHMHVNETMHDIFFCSIYVSHY